MTSQQKQKGGGAKKHGRNRKRCEAYKLMASRLANKIKRLKRHVLRNQKMVDRKLKRGLEVKYDKQARSALKRLTA